MKTTSALALILGSIATLFILGSGIEAVPTDASWWCWAGIWITTLLAVAVGIIGVHNLERMES